MKGAFTWTATVLLFSGTHGFAEKVPHFSGQLHAGSLASSAIHEASGIAASRRNPNVLYTHNDSGGLNVIYAFNPQGKHLGAYIISGALAQDWEDIAVGPGPAAGVSYIYIGDIGDNAVNQPIHSIYRIPEPAAGENQLPVSVTLFGTGIIRFRYPDGPRDAETLMVDPLTRDLYVISKREAQVRVYRAAYPQSTTSIITLQKVATLGFTSAVGGDISPDGGEILVKTYGQVYFWKRKAGQSVAQAMGGAPLRLPYTPEIQSEAIGWKADASGYYTVGEGSGQSLHFYQRLQQANDFEGDSKADIAVLNTNTYLWFMSTSAGIVNCQYGAAGMARCAGDYNGDRKWDPAVYDLSTHTFFINLGNGQQTIRTFGYNGCVPAPGDYDGDGKTDMAVFDARGGQWHVLQSRAGYRMKQFGFANSRPVPADYDGDAKTDFAFFEPGPANWHILESRSGAYRIQQFGFDGTLPVPGDYDGDGNYDVAVYEPARGRWFLLRTSAGYAYVQFGYAGTIPVACDYDGDGRTDVGVYDPASFNWHISRSTAGYLVKFFGNIWMAPVLAY